MPVREGQSHKRHSPNFLIRCPCQKLFSISTALFYTASSIYTIAYNYLSGVKCVYLMLYGDKEVKMAKLITGGTGIVGAELAHMLVERGEDVVIFHSSANEDRIQDIKNKVKIVRGDLGSLHDVLNVVRDNKITQIYHIGAMLSYVSEINPWGSFRVNVDGIYNVLEAARLFNVDRMMFASSGATFSPYPTEDIDDLTIQRPGSIYGCAKLLGEGLGDSIAKGSALISVLSATMQ